MKILLVNGSPRRVNANSYIVLDELCRRLGNSHEYRMIETISGEARPEDIDVDFIILAFPLYIDSLHSRLLSWLMSYEALIEKERNNGRPPKRIGMIAVANNGFYEGEQNKTALDIVRNFCIVTGIEWKGGLGIGTGEMLKGLRSAPDYMFLKRPVSSALDAMAERVKQKVSGEDGEGLLHLYTEHAFPRFAYAFMGNRGWVRTAKANGLKKHDIRARPFLEKPERSV